MIVVGRTLALVEARNVSDCRRQSQCEDVCRVVARGAEPMTDRSESAALRPKPSHPRSCSSSRWNN